MSLVPPPISCRQPWPGWVGTPPRQAFLEWKEQKRGSKSCFLPLHPLSSYCTTLRNRLLYSHPPSAPPLLLAWVDAGLQLCLTHQGLEPHTGLYRAWNHGAGKCSPRDGPHHFPVHSRFHQNLPPQTSLRAAGVGGGVGGRHGWSLPWGGVWPQLLAPLFRMNAFVSKSESDSTIQNSRKILLPTCLCGQQGAWWQDDWVCQGWHCCAQLFTSPQCLCSFVALLTSLLGLSVQTHLGCGLSRWALSWPHQLVGWPLGTMPSEKQLIRAQTVLWCLESPLVTPKPLFDFPSGNKARSRRWAAPRIDLRCNNPGVQVLEDALEGYTEVNYQRCRRSSSSCFSWVRCQVGTLFYPLTWPTQFARYHCVIKSPKEEIASGGLCSSVGRSASGSLVRLGWDIRRREYPKSPI